ncbi:MAG: glycosyltransferase family 4 protein [Ramlibacter sp.]|nr:glycosyltransferase family 4 protein [Ramlibacter sp.]
MSGPARRLRVAVLNRVFSSSGGGAESYSIRLVEQLAARHEIHVFAQQIAHQWPGVTYHRVSSPLAKPRWINQLWYATATWLATRRGFDVVHSHENSWHGRVQTIHVRPVRHNLLAGRTGWRRALRWLKIATSPRLLTYLWLEGARFRQRPGQQVVLTSSSLQADAVAAYPHAAGAMSVVTPGVAMPEPGWDPATARRELGLPAGARLLLFVANDYARKGLATLLEALALLPRDLQLVVVGHPGQQRRFSDIAAALGVSQQVHFLGAIDRLALAYQAADMLVHPTLEDTFAMVVLEALAYGLPVVVSGPARCGISTLLRDGREALLLTDPRDAKALAEAVRRVLADDPLRQRLASQARKFARDHDWERAAEGYERLYRASITAAK